jgi:hypothetical protein
MNAPSGKRAACAGKQPVTRAGGWSAPSAGSERGTLAPVVMAQKAPPQPTAVPELNAVQRELVAGAQAILADNFVAAYLQGSLPMGD